MHFGSERTPEQERFAEQLVACREIAAVPDARVKRFDEARSAHRDLCSGKHKQHPFPSLRKIRASGWKLGKHAQFFQALNSTIAFASEARKREVWVVWPENESRHIRRKSSEKVAKFAECLSI
jgi:hypothetical protein